MSGRKGFTLIEMMAVVAIILILAAGVGISAASYISHANTAADTVESQIGKYDTALAGIKMLETDVETSPATETSTTSETTSSPTPTPAESAAPTPIPSPVPDHTVTFADWNGIVLLSQTVADGGTAFGPAPSRPGYIFVGWDKNLTNITSDMTATAQYNPEVYAIKFAAGKGSPTPASVNVNYGSTIPKPSSPTWNKSHPFLGWYSAATGGTEWDFTMNTVTGEMTLYAQYQ